MREILFRGKTEKGKWVQGSLIKRNIGCFIVDENNKCALRKTSEHLFDFESNLVISKTVGQFTGLTDKNGTKIFEGDIIRYADNDEYRMYLESLECPEEYEGISFSDLWTIDSVVYGIEIGYPAFDLNNHEWECNGLSNLKESYQYFYEVIGNIHDNPELLKEQQND